MHGNDLPALYLPATCLAPLPAGRLLLFFDRLYCYQSAEDTPLPDNQLTRANLLRGYAPVPLGEELGHFRRLLKDMQGHATEYYQAYLSSLAAGAEEDVEAGWRQVARRLKGTAPAGAGKQGRLWRARLFLALAETQAALQEELAAGIQTVTRRETEMLRLLQGEEEEIPDLPLLSTATTATFPVRSEQLLAAWGLLYLADSRPERPWLLATADEESAGLLFDEYERATGRIPEELISLEAPFSLASEEASGNWRALSAAAGDILARLGDFLTGAAFPESGAEAAASGLNPADLAAGWQRMTERHRQDHTKKPVAEDDASGPVPAGFLTFYRLAGMSFPRLFSLFCRHAQEGSEPAAPVAILAVLKK
jgi:hypothetical protein